MELTRTQEQLSSLRSLLVLSMLMFEAHDEHEILRLASTSVASLGSCRPLGAYLRRGDELAPWPDALPLGSAVDQQILALDGADGSVTLPDHFWSHALSLRGVSGNRGYLLVCCDQKATDGERFLLDVLSQQTGAALTVAAMFGVQEDHARDLGSLTEQLTDANARLTTTVSELEAQRRTHEALTQVTVGGAGLVGIVDVLHSLTQLPVVAEDRFGRVLAAAGLPGGAAPRTARSSERDQFIRGIQAAGRPVQVGERLIALAQPRDNVLGTIALVDPHRRAGALEVFALEHAATALAMELAHQQGMAEVELRLRRDLVDDLLAGADAASAHDRATAVGHDLRLPHCVLVCQADGAAKEDAVTAVREVARRLKVSNLAVRRDGTTVLIAQLSTNGDGPANWRPFYDAVRKQLRKGALAVGVGGSCDQVEDYPRSWQEATRALGIRLRSRTPAGITCYDELGLYRLLSHATDPEIEQFVREWLGALIDYDRAHRTELVETLTMYLECGGNYDETANSLTIHRSTLRYRLQRIREVSQFELNDVEHRLNLHLATRAWAMLDV